MGDKTKHRWFDMMPKWDLGKYLPPGSYALPGDDYERQYLGEVPLCDYAYERRPGLPVIRTNETPVKQITDADYTMLMDYLRVAYGIPFTGVPSFGEEEKHPSYSGHFCPRCGGKKYEMNCANDYQGGVCNWPDLPMSKTPEERCTHAQLEVVNDSLVICSSHKCMSRWKILLPTYYRQKDHRRPRRGDTVVWPADHELFGAEPSHHLLRTSRGGAVVLVEEGELVAFHVTELPAAKSCLEKRLLPE